MRLKGLEPPRLSAPDPKSGAATNYATVAKESAKVRFFSNYLTTFGAIFLFLFIDYDSIGNLCIMHPVLFKHIFTKGNTNRTSESLAHDTGLYAVFD